MFLQRPWKGMVHYNIDIQDTVHEYRYLLSSEASEIDTHDTVETLTFTQLEKSNFKTCVQSE
jgi:hypothetical protein